MKHTKNIVLISLSFLLVISLVTPSAYAKTEKNTGNFCQRIDQVTAKKLKNVANREAKREKHISQKIARISAKQAKTAEKQAKRNARISELTAKKSTVDQAITAYTGAINTASARAKVECANKVTPSSVHKTYKQNIQAAQKAFLSNLKAAKK